LIQPASEARNQKIERILLPATFFVTVLFLSLHHDMWRDELHAWLFATHSDSILELFHNIRYEGHPCLWYLSLWFIARFSHDPILMQVFHTLLSTAAIWLFLAYSPFKRLEKILFMFGYYPFCEYAVMSRNYVLDELFLFSFLTCYCLPRRKNILAGSALFLLSFSDAFGCILAITLGLAWVFELFLDKKLKSAFIIGEGFGVGLFILAGITLSLYQVIPPADSPIYTLQPPWNPQRLMVILQALYQAFTPLEDYLWGWPLWAGGLFLAAWILNLRNLLSAFLFTVGSFGVLLFLGFNGYFLHSEPRWAGHLFLLFIAGQWFAHQEAFQRFEISKPFLRPFQGKFRAVVFPGLLGFLILPGLVFEFREFNLPYSAGRAAADFIKANHWEDMPMVGSPLTYTTTLSGYLDRPLYQAGHGRWGTFPIWDKPWDKPMPAAQLTQIMGAACRYNSSALLILAYSMPDLPKEFQLVGAFTQGQVERFWVYYWTNPSKF
jgi:hypothetical protein